MLRRATACPPRARVRARNGFSNNWFSSVVTNDGPVGFSSTDGITNPIQAPDMHQITLNYDDFGSMFVDGQPFNLSAHFTNATLIVPNNAEAIGNQGGFGTGFATTGSGFFTPFKCNGAGQVFDVYGASEYVGLGFLTFSTIMAVEVFGSPFMRNCSCVIGLLWGYAAATWSSTPRPAVRHARPHGALARHHVSVDQGPVLQD